MISFDEAFAALLADLRPTAAETAPLADARGRVLAAALVAQRTQPPTATSAMDGFAVRAASLGEKPARLKIVGESAAGHPLGRSIAAGEAARISTGATIPAEADQVVALEDSSVNGDHVTLDARPAPGAHIRPVGVDFSRGDTLLEAGRRLAATACALVAAAGVSTLSVHRRPRVAILSTGDELVEPGEPAGDHQIVNSNAVAVAGLVAEAGGEPDYLGIARDDPAAVRALYEKARGADLLVTIGGASVGEHDHVRAVFAEAGGRLVFERIAIKPGKPTWYGRMQNQPVLGLPGNPVSAIVVAQLLLVPAVRRLAGEAAADRLGWRTAQLAEDLPPTGPRETFLRAELVSGGGRPRARSLPNQDSAALSALVAADALIRRRAEAPEALDGDTIEILPLRGA